MLLTKLTLHHTEFWVKESVEEIVKRKNEAGEMGDLFFTVAIPNNEEHPGYPASCIAGLYRSVRQVELIKNKKEEEEKEEEKEEKAE